MGLWEAEIVAQDRAVSNFLCIHSFEKAIDLMLAEMCPSFI